MSKSLTRLRSSAALACALALSATLVPTTAFASEGSPNERSFRLRASVQAAAVVESHRLEKRVATSAARQASGQTTRDPKLESPSFFRTPVGVAVLAAFGVGVGYALYSASNDRILSSGR